MASGGKKDKNYIRFSWEQLELQCEWRECDMKTDQLHAYLQHVDNHIHSEPEETDCRWRDCAGFSGNRMELSMHVLFHAFHTKIKCFGRNLLRRKKIGTCSYDERARNIIPDVYEMYCHWDNCGVAFLSAETFFRHVDVHAEDNPKGNNLAVSVECKWQDCTSSFKSLYRLKEHMRCHTQERVMACPVCGSMFASRTKFFDHVKRQGSGNGSGSEEPTFQCGCCSRKMASERLLRDHMRHHINHYKCPYCDMTCPTPSGVRRHIMYRHDQKKSFKCTECDYAGKSMNDLRRHLDRHTKDSNYCCEISDCNYSTYSEGMLNKHVKSAHDCSDESPTFMCHICQKLFTRGHYLTKHLVRVHHLHWPSGHCRFRYHLHDDGYYKLQTVRYESIELSDALLDDEKSDVDSDKNSATQETGKFPEKIVGLPVVVYVPSDSMGEKEQENLIQQSVSVVATDNNTYITPNGSPFVCVNMEEPSGSNVRTIQFVTKGEDGSTIVQTGEIIADGSQGHCTVLP